MRIYLLILTLLVLVMSCHKKNPGIDLSSLMGKNKEQLVKQMGEPQSVQTFPPTEGLREKVRLFYKAKYFDTQGDMMLSIDNQTDTVTFIQFYVEGGNYVDNWIQQLKPLLGMPYTQEQWLTAINNDFIYQDRTPQLILNLYQQGAREWPLTKNGYLYEIGTSKLTKPREYNLDESILVEATWIRIFNTKILSQAKNPT